MALLALLAVLLSIQLWQARTTGITVDEPNHLLASHFYWDGGKVMHVPDLAPLLKITTGWVPKVIGNPIPPSSEKRWQTRDEWGAGTIWSSEMKNPQHQDFLFRFRLPVLIFPLLTAMLLWHWAGREWGATAGLVAAAIFVFEPTALAHGSLIKNDVAAAFGYLAFWYAAWRFWLRPGWLEIALLSMATLAGVLAKLSLIILTGIAPVVVLAALLHRRKLKFLIPYLAILAGVVYLGLCTAYLWDVRILHPLEIEHKFNDPKIPWLFTWVAQIFQYLPVPQYFWEGCVGLFWSSGDGSSVFLNGDVSRTGDRLYFLWALAWKAPAAYQILFIASGLWCLWTLIRHRDPLPLFLLIPPVLYIGLASQSTLQYGIRLILPALPFAALLAARASLDFRKPVLALALLGVIESGIYIPHTLSFFNVWAGGPANGIRYLADSNIDWGQDLPQLAAWYEKNPVPGLKLCYFGMDSQWRYFDDKQITSIAPPWSPEFTKGRTALEPEPGSVYAISATLLPGHYFRPEYRDYYKYFRDHKPTARAGWSILIYDLRQPEK